MCWARSRRSTSRGSLRTPARRAVHPSRCSAHEWSALGRPTSPRSRTSCRDGGGPTASTRDLLEEENAMWEQVQEALNQSAARVLTGMASLLPGVVALVLAVVVAALAAWLIELLVRRLLRGLSFDKRLERAGLTELKQWTPGGSPTR